MQLVPQVENDRTTMVGSSIQPITNGIFVNLQDTTGCSNGISFGQGTDGHLENHWFAFQTIVGGGITQGDTPVTSLTQSLRLTITGTIFDHPALPKGNTVVFTAFVRTIKCFPIHFCTLDQHLLCFRGYADISYFHYLIKENEGQHPKPRAATQRWLSRSGARPANRVGAFHDPAGKESARLTVNQPRSTHS